MKSPFSYSPGQAFKVKRTTYTTAKRPMRGACYGGGEDRYISPGEVGTLALITGNGWQALNLDFSRGRFVPFATYYTAPFASDGLPCMAEDATALVMSADDSEFIKIKTPAVV